MPSVPCPGEDRGPSGGVVPRSAIKTATWPDDLSAPAQFGAPAAVEIDDAGDVAFVHLGHEPGDVLDHPGSVRAEPAAQVSMRVDGGYGRPWHVMLWYDQPWLWPVVSQRQLAQLLCVRVRGYVACTIPCLQWLSSLRVRPATGPPLRRAGPPCPGFAAASARRWSAGRVLRPRRPIPGWPRARRGRRGTAR
jgi:hypothetical protein